MEENKIMRYGFLAAGLVFVLAVCWWLLSEPDVRDQDKKPISITGIQTYHFRGSDWYIILDTNDPEFNLSAVASLNTAGVTVDGVKTNGWFQITTDNAGKLAFTLATDKAEQKVTKLTITADGELTQVPFGGAELPLASKPWKPDSIRCLIRCVSSELIKSSYSFWIAASLSAGSPLFSRYFNSLGVDSILQYSFHSFHNLLSRSILARYITVFCGNIHILRSNSAFKTGRSGCSKKKRLL